MTFPTDPQAAIDRLRATIPGLSTGHITQALLPAYGQYENYIEASVAFAADIETLASLTQVGWGIGYTDAKGRAVELWKVLDDGSSPKPGFGWFPVYARVPQ